MKRNHFLMIFVFGYIGITFAQEEEEARERIIAEAKQYVAEGNKVLVKDGNFPKAEGEYRKAINANIEDVSARYNLANSYYNSKKYDEAHMRYKETVKIATSKEEKHKAFHNQGNTFMEQKKYKEAVEAYKNALRNNPKDEETRYNLALAKKMLEEEEKKNDQNQDNKDDKKDQNKDQDKKDKGDQDKKDQEGDDKKEDKKDEGDKEEDKKDKEGDDKKEGKQDEKEGDQKGDPKEQKQQPQQVQGQLSPQQVKSLLEAMSNEEKKVQKKINAKKAKGAKTKSEKDW